MRSAERAPGPHRRKPSLDGRQANVSRDRQGLLEVCPRPASRSVTELATDALDTLHADDSRVSHVDGAHPTPAQQEHVNSSGS